MTCHQIESVDGFFVGVYDGHGGWQMSQFASDRLHQELEKSLKAKRAIGALSEEEVITGALLEAYDSVENEFLDVATRAYNLGFPNVSRVGSCALTAVVSNNRVYAANAGDCKGVICKYNAKEKRFTCRKINQKFNANSKKEQSRLRAAFQNENDIVVCRRGQKDSCYVKNRLQPTRAFGDFRLKHPLFNNPNNEPTEKGYPLKIANFNGPYITHRPDIKVFDLDQDDEFLILATDGLWDELNVQDVESIVLEAKNDKVAVIDTLFKQAFKHAAVTSNKTEDELKNMSLGARRNYHDDISIVVVDLKNQFHKN